jgi:AcrR family transcriptional regulator
MEREPDAHTDAGGGSSMGTVTARTRPGRHRSASADAAILDATLELLRERGYRALTVAAVIERAGVSSATLYRRWPSKPELVAAAIASLVPESFEVDTGTLAGDMSAFVHHVADSIAARGNILELLGAGASEDTELAGAIRQKLLDPRVRALSTILRRARDRGELDAVPPTDTSLALVVGPVHYRATALGEPVTPAFLRQLTAHILRGLGADPNAG